MTWLPASLKPNCSSLFSPSKAIGFRDLTKPQSETFQRYFNLNLPTSYIPKVLSTKEVTGRYREPHFPAHLQAKNSRGQDEVKQREVWRRAPGTRALPTQESPNPSKRSCLWETWVCNTMPCSAQSRHFEHTSCGIHMYPTLAREMAQWVGALGFGSQQPRWSQALPIYGVYTYMHVLTNTHKSK